MFAPLYNKKLYLLKADPRGLVRTLDGCIDGKWNAHVYEALEGLHSLGLITGDEHDEYMLHLRKKSSEKDKQWKIEQALRTLEDNGLEVTVKKW